MKEIMAKEDASFLVTHLPALAIMTMTVLAFCFAGRTKPSDSLLEEEKQKFLKQILQENDELEEIDRALSDCAKRVREYNATVRYKNSYHSVLQELSTKIMAENINSDQDIEVLREKEQILELSNPLAELRTNYPTLSSDPISSHEIMVVARDREEHHQRMKEITLLYIDKTYAFLRQNCVIEQEDSQILINRRF